MFSLFQGSVPVSDVVCKGDLSCIKEVSSESAERCEVTPFEPCKERDLGYSEAKRRLVFETPDKVKRKRSILANRAKRMRYKHINYKERIKLSKKCNEEEVIDDSINTCIEDTPPVVNEMNDLSTITPVKDATSINNLLVSDSKTITGEYLDVQRKCEEEGFHLLPQVILTQV